MTAADPQASQAASTGAAVRFPFPPMLFAVPLALALAADRWVLRLPLPAAGRRGTRATGAAVAVGGRAAQPLRRADRPAPGHDGRAPPCGDPAGHHRPLPVDPQPDVHRARHRAPRRRATDRVWWPLLVAPLCMRATTRLVIVPEEEYLADRFGEDYQRYRARVRRWI